MKLPLFELTNILKLDAQEIINARTKAISIHHTGDVDASGDEVEVAVRKMIRKKLPLEYYVSHGHIVDKKLAYNGQHDIIIADNSGSPILFTAENGTEYFPYESIYAIGEVKSSYYSSRNYFENFIEKNRRMYNELERLQTSPNQLTKDIKLDGTRGIQFIPSSSEPYKNPIYKCMFFVEGASFSFSDVKDIYTNTEDKYLPNLVCILNKGLIVKSKMKGESVDVPELFPEFIKDSDSGNYRWTFIQLGKGTDTNAAHLAFFIFALNHHLKNCVVLRPHLMDYFSSLFTIDNAVTLQVTKV